MYRTRKMFGIDIRARRTFLAENRSTCSRRVRDVSSTLQLAKMTSLLRNKPQAERAEVAIHKL